MVVKTAVVAEARKESRCHLVGNLFLLQGPAGQAF